MIAQVGQIFSISELEALIANVGIVAVLVATSSPVLLLLARMDETSCQRRPRRIAGRTPGTSPPRS